MIKSVAFCLSIVMLSSPAVRAELNIFHSPDDFGDNTVTLTFTGSAPGSEASGLLGRWGVSFVGEPVIAELLRPDFPLMGPPFTSLQSVLVNPQAGPLVIELPPGVRRVGLVMSNGNIETQASVRAFGRFGEELGEAQVSGFTAPGAQRLVGLDADGAALSRVLVDYTTGNPTEELDELLLEFLVVPTFSQWIPQFVIAKLGGNSEMTTEIRAVNISPPSSATMTASFFASDGSPLAVVIDDISVTEITMDRVNPFASITLAPESEEMVVGSVRLTANRPFEASALFRHIGGDGTVRTSAGILGDPGGFFRVGTVIHDEKGRSTGIALVNTGNEEAMVQVTIHRSNGAFPPISLEPIVLGARGHRAFFVEEVYPEVIGVQGTVTLLMSSAQPIAVTLIETIDGFVSASLPLSGP